MNEPSTSPMTSELIPAKKLKVFMVEEDSHDHEPLHLKILHLLRDAGIAGATVFKATQGFGERRVIHSTMSDISSMSMPITIEATDLPAKIDAIIPRISELMVSGLVEVSRTFILHTPGSNQDTVASSKGEESC